jgi:sugar phosphate isomerase/epimerase
MSDIDQIIEGASRLPLNDAAYELWMRKWQLDRLEPTYRPTQPQGVDLKNPKLFQRVVRNAFAKVLHEREIAPDGPTFDRLKRAHPEASDDDLRRAIKAAVKFDTDCVKNFSYSSPNYFDDVTRAVDLAKSENPGFQDRTYEFAQMKLAEAMR